MMMSLAWHLTKRALGFALMGALLCAIVGMMEGAVFGFFGASLLHLNDDPPVGPGNSFMAGANLGISFGLILSPVIGGVAWSIVGVSLPPLHPWLDVIRAVRWRIWTWPLVGGASGAVSGIGAGILSNFVTYDARDWHWLSRSAFDYGYCYGCLAGYTVALFAAILTGGLSAARQAKTL